MLDAKIPRQYLFIFNSKLIIPCTSSLVELQSFCITMMSYTLSASQITATSIVHLAAYSSNTKENYWSFLKWIQWSTKTQKQGKVFSCHDDVIKWKHFPRYWPFVRGIHRWPVNSPHKDQSRGALMFSLICAWTGGWVNNGEAGDLRRLRAHYDVIVMGWWGISIVHDGNN